MVNYVNNFLKVLKNQNITYDTLSINKKQIHGSYNILNNIMSKNKMNFECIAINSSNISDLVGTFLYCMQEEKVLHLIPTDWPEKLINKYLKHYSIPLLISQKNTKKRCIINTNYNSKFFKKEKGIVLADLLFDKIMIFNYDKLSFFNDFLKKQIILQGEKVSISTDIHIGYQVLMLYLFLMQGKRVHIVKYNKLFFNNGAKNNILIASLNLFREDFLYAKYENKFSTIITLGKEEFNATDYKNKCIKLNCKWYNFFGFPNNIILSSLKKVKVKNQYLWRHYGRPIFDYRVKLINQNKQNCAKYEKGLLALSEDSKKFFNTEYLCFLDENSLLLFEGYNEFANYDAGYYKLSTKSVNILLQGNQSISKSLVLYDEKISSVIFYFESSVLFDVQSILSLLSQYFPKSLLNNSFYFYLLPCFPKKNGNVDILRLKETFKLNNREIKEIRTTIQKKENISEVFVDTRKNFLPKILKLSNGNKLFRDEDLYIRRKNKRLAIIKAKKVKKVNFNNCIELFKYNAKIHPTNKIFFHSADKVQTSINYKDLYVEIASFAFYLKQQGIKKGDKVIIQLRYIKDFIIAFWSIISLGATALPMTYIYKSKKEYENNLLKVKNALTNFPNACLVLDFSDNPLYSKSFKKKLIFYKKKYKYDLKAIDKEIKSIKNSDYAVIFFTSGSTGAPKAIPLSHINMLAHASSFIEDHKMGNKSTVMFNCMPLDHVGSIQMMHFTGIFIGAVQVHTDTSLILNDPIQWLEIIQKYKVTTTWAPNFIFKLLNSVFSIIKKTNINLSSIKHIFNGGEMINIRDCNEFLDNYRYLQLCSNTMIPAYGMSETTSGIVFSKDFHNISNELYHNKGVAVLGSPIPGLTIRITKNSIVLKEGEIGTLEVKGDSVFTGYMENYNIRRDNFTNDHWFNTGDLGFINNKQLILVGRDKEIVVKNGENFSFLEIENTLRKVEGLELSVACVSQDYKDHGTMELFILFICPKYFNNSYLSLLYKKINNSLSKKFGFIPDCIIPLDKNNIPLTSIGKIQRKKLINDFIDNKFDIVYNNRGQVSQNKEISVLIPKWEKVISYHDKEIINKKNIIIFPDRKGLCKHFIKELHAANLAEEIIIVKSADKLELSSRELTFDKNNYAELADIFSYIKDKYPDKSWYVMDFTYYDNPKDNKNLIEQSRSFLYPIIYLLKSIIESNIIISLTIIAKNSLFFAPNKDEFDITKGTLRGLLKTAKLEVGQKLKINHINFIDDSAEKNAKHLIKELKINFPNEEITIFNNRKYQYLLTPIVTKESAVKFTTEGFYLIIGGLGGIGRRICEFLLTYYKSLKILILGRSDIKKIQSYLSKIRVMNNNIYYETCDLQDFLDIKLLIKKYEKKFFSPLVGIINLAGTGNLEDHIKNSSKHWIKNEALTSYEDMFQAKVIGTLNILNLLEVYPDIFITMFSSITGLIGSPTFSAYAAANSFLDQICYFYSSQGYKVLSLNWSEWENIGMTEITNKDAISSASRAAGYELIPANIGVRLFKNLYAYKNSLYIGLDYNNNKIQNIISYNIGLKYHYNIYYTTDEIEKQNNISDILVPYKDNIGNFKIHKLKKFPKLSNGEIDTAKLYNAALQSTHVNEMMIQENINRPQNSLQEALLESFVEVLKIDNLDIKSNFFANGGQSIIASELIVKIQQKLSFNLNVVDIFENPTVIELSELLIRQSERKLEEKSYNKEDNIKTNLTETQLRLWLQEKTSYNTAINNVPIMLNFNGKLYPQHLKKAFKIFYQKHKNLNMVVSEDKNTGMPILKYLPSNVLPLYFYQTADFNVKIRNLAQKSINIEKGPLLELHIFKVKTNNYLFLILAHHIVFDGFSAKILLKELGNLYTDFMNGRSSHFQNTVENFNDSSIFPEECYKPRHLNYWVDYLKNYENLKLNYDYEYNHLRSSKGEIISKAIESPEITKKILSFCKKNKITPFIFCLSVCGLYLYKLSNIDNFIIGYPIACREDINKQDIIGLFSKFLMIKFSFKDLTTFNEVLEYVLKHVITAQKYKDFKFTNLLDQLNVKKTDVSTPLYQVWFALDDSLETEQSFSGLSFYELDPYVTNTKFDLQINVRMHQNEFKTYFTYAQELFKSETMYNNLDNFLLLIEEILNNENVLLSNFIS